MKNYSSFLVKFFVLSLFLCFLFQSQSFSQEKDRYSSIKEALSKSSRLSGSNGPSNVNWIDDGNRYSYMQYNFETESMEIRAYDPMAGEDELIFNNKDHTFPNNNSTFKYSSFQWSEDSRHIVFRSNFRPVYRHSGISDYYLYSVENESIELLVEDARTAELSPDGRKIGYEREGDLFVYDLSSGEETQLTRSAKEYFYNGRFGWVYEEEFGLSQAWAWSPDSKHIAYWQTDERHVKIFQMTDYSGQHPEYEKTPYPKVGDENPKVRIGIVNVENGSQQWMDTPEGGYIPRIYWTADESKLAIVHLNRPQNHLRLFFNDISSGDNRLVMEEKSDAWIDVYDFFAGIDHLFFFPKNSKEFFRISDKNGWNHIYRFGYDGSLKNQVTSGKWEVTNMHTVDYRNNRIYYTSSEESPLERHLYSVNFSGRNKQKLTEVEGKHDISMGSNGKYFINRYSNVSTPTQVELWSIMDGKMEVLEDNASVNEYLDSHVYSPKELFSFTTSGGQKLDGAMIKPIDFDSTKSYPLILSIYGGPSAQGVYNTWSSSGWTQYLAQEGYIVVDVNNRGSGGYGSKFEDIVYKQLGKWEANDFVETAQYLAQKDWIDGNRMAMQGHSHGGYMTTYTLFTHPGVFDVGIATAPVTDFRYYNSIFSERYMGLLKENEQGYNQTASLTHAKNLKDHLLLSHSAMDRNVHMQNTMQLLTELTSNGIDVDLRIYPPGSHNVAFNTASYYLLYDSYIKYLNRFLK